MKTVLITGCSTGFGKDAVSHFLDRDWNVVATMRDMSKEDLPASDRLTVLTLDVTNEKSIAACIEKAGPIDCLVNNAGIGWLNALEGSSLDTIRQVFETNTFGTMAMIKAVLPQFRERNSGVIINVSSSVTQLPLPLLSVYTASKAAVNAFSESFALELEPFNIRVRVVLPGRAPDTAFAENARQMIKQNGGFPEPYEEMVSNIFKSWEEEPHAAITTSRDVSEAIWYAATDSNSPFLIPAGADAVAMAENRAA